VTFCGFGRALQSLPLTLLQDTRSVCSSVSGTYSAPVSSDVTDTDDGCSTDSYNLIRTLPPRQAQKIITHTHTCESMTASPDWLPSIDANAAAATIGDGIRRLTESGAFSMASGVATAEPTLLVGGAVIGPLAKAELVEYSRIASRISMSYSHSSRTSRRSRRCSAGRLSSSTDWRSSASDSASSSCFQRGQGGRSVARTPRWSDTAGVPNTVALVTWNPRTNT